MTNLTLQNLLSKLPPSSTCLLFEDEVFNIAQIIDYSINIREDISNVENGRIALVGLMSIDLIKVAIALDGYVEALLFLPNSVETKTKEMLIKEAGCTHIVDSSINVLSLEKENKKNGKNYNTKWILATSGTTGSPKLIEHSLESLTRSIKYNSEKGSLYRWGLMYEPSRFAGLQVILQALLGGSSLVLPKTDYFSESVQALIDLEVNAISATPTMWRKLLIDKRIMNLKLKQITLGGEIADQSILDVLRRNFPKTRITHIYASTEAGTGFAVNDGKAGFPKSWLETGKGPVPLKISQSGHLMINPFILPKGDFLLSKLDKDGFIDTEDLVSVQGDRVYFHGRESGVINVGGNKVHPELIEQKLRELKGIEDVRIYAKKNVFVGELVALDVIPNEGVDENILHDQIIRFCRQSFLSWQIPAVIKFVKSLKINKTGKLDRRAL